MTAIQKISVYQRVKAHGPTQMVPTLRLCNSPGSQTSGDHFNSRGHSLADKEFSVLEIFKKENPSWMRRSTSWRRNTRKKLKSMCSKRRSVFQSRNSEFRNETQNKTELDKKIHMLVSENTKLLFMLKDQKYLLKRVKESL